MRIVTTIREMQQARQHWQQHKSAGFVPTMGYLHEGHLSLVRQARAENDFLIVSIFVNPTQFGPEEDLEQYPRDLQRDLQMLEEAGVDFVFTPDVQEIYPAGFASYIDITGPLATEVEGTHRPGHFRGVATIVLKLFQIVQPGRAYFGQKDAQQVAIIKRIISDFHLPIELCIQPTIREASGLAMSSRNIYLSQEEKEVAAILYQALLAGKAAFEQHPDETPEIVTHAIQARIEKEPRARPSKITLIYAELRNPIDFQPLKRLCAPALLLLAAQVGPARLIDNFLLREDGTWDTGSISLTETEKDANHAR